MTRSDRPVASARFGSRAVLFFVLSVVVSEARAGATEPDEAGARALFVEGRKLADAGRYEEACPKFEESLRLAPGVGTSFNLADCQEHVGRTASAWARFLDVATATRLAGQGERERVARARAAALEPRLARLVVIVPAPDDGLIVLRDKLPVGASAWGIPVPVDPGIHRVEARAPARKDWSYDMTVPDAPTTIEVSVPRLEPVSAPSVSLSLPAGAVGGGAPPTLARAPGAAPVRRWSPRTMALGALGAAALGTAAVFALRVRSENEEAKGLCPGSTCGSSDQKARHDGLVEDAHRDQTLAIISSAVGAGALLVAAYFWWRPGRPPPTRIAAGSFLVRPTFKELASGSGPGTGLWGANLEAEW